jgi:diguanylate cyclase
MRKGERLADLVAEGESWLMARILDYAKKHDYTKYTSTLEEAWRLSIEGLSERLINALTQHEAVPELTPDEDYSKDDMASFGVLEAQRHRERGVPLGMFLGLMKYYVQGYQDLVSTAHFDPDYEEWCHLFVKRFFDRVELGFCVEWSGMDHETHMRELQATNRRMTNEKNRYLTVFESLPVAVFLLDTTEQIVNQNHRSELLFGKSGSPGALYYGAETRSHGTLPWLAEKLNEFLAGREQETVFEAALETNIGLRHFEVKLKRMLDVSDKFSGTTVILNDITARREAQSALSAHVDKLETALSEIETLQGLLPICSYCKNIRDDQNYWQRIDTYVSEHSRARFTHSVCPECYEKYLKPQLEESERDAESGEGRLPAGPHN